MWRTHQIKFWRRWSLIRQDQITNSLIHFLFYAKILFDTISNSDGFFFSNDIGGSERFWRLNKTYFNKVYILGHIFNGPSKLQMNYGQEKIHFS